MLTEPTHGFDPLWPVSRGNSPIELFQNIRDIADHLVKVWSPTPSGNKIYLKTRVELGRDIARITIATMSEFESVQSFRDLIAKIVGDGRGEDRVARLTHVFETLQHTTMSSVPVVGLFRDHYEEALRQFTIEIARSGGRYSTPDLLLGEMMQVDRLLAQFMSRCGPGVSFEVLMYHLATYFLCTFNLALEDMAKMERGPEARDEE